MPVPGQMDLLTDWAPSEPVERFDSVMVRASSITGRISKAVAASLKGKNRDDIAKRMSDYLGTPFSKAMLDSYASEAREDHVISVPRLIALIHATRDRRLLQIFADDFGWAVVEGKHVHRIAQAEIEDKIKELSRQQEYLRRRARG